MRSRSRKTAWMVFHPACYSLSVWTIPVRRVIPLMFDVGILTAGSTRHIAAASESNFPDILLYISFESLFRPSNHPHPPEPDIVHDQKRRSAACQRAPSPGKFPFQRFSFADVFCINFRLIFMSGKLWYVRTSACYHARGERQLGTHTAGYSTPVEMTRRCHALSG